MDLKAHVRGIPDYPKPGLLFYDISTLIANPKAWKYTIDTLSEEVQKNNPSMLAGIEARGFLLASALALNLNLGFTMIRKKGKLPGHCISYDYELEYGMDCLEIQADAIKPGQRVIILDDLLATGGTMLAASKLLKQVKAEVISAACIIELDFLNARQKLDMPCYSLISYDD